jgi:Mn-dependent DtxR family transcriptional regulator
MFAPGYMEPTPKRKRKAPVQDAILEFLRDYKRDPENDGNSPSFQDIAAAIGKYRSDVRKRIIEMERYGWVKINAKGKIVLIGGKYILPD